VIKHRYFLILIFLFFISQAYCEIKWQTDFKDALKIAKLEKKDVFAYFTGSDWCSFCKVMKKEVFEKTDFIDGIQKKFILLKIDFPKKKPLPIVQQQKNDNLAREYSIEGFPTILLLDSSGRCFAKTGYTGTSSKDYLLKVMESIKKKIERDRHLVAASKLKGVEKAAALGKAIEVVGDVPRLQYKAVIDEILKADPKDESGYKATLVLKQKLAALENQVVKLVESSKTLEAQKIISDFLSEFKPEGEAKQKAMLYRIYTYEKDSIDFDQVEKYLDSIIAISPKSESANDARGVKAQVQQLRQSSKKP